METEKKKFKTLAIDETLKQKLNQVMIMMGEKMTYSEVISQLIDSYTAKVQKTNEEI